MSLWNVCKCLALYFLFLTIVCFQFFSCEAFLHDFFNFWNFNFLTYFWGIFLFFTFLKISFLLFVNSKYSLFPDFFISGLLTWIFDFLIYWFLDVFVEIFQFLKFSKMSILIFFIFCLLFLFEDPLIWLFEYFEFVVYVCICSNFYFLKGVVSQCKAQESWVI